MKTIQVKTPRRECFVDITNEVEREASESKVKNGLCTVFIPHTTAGVTINENADPDVCRDMLAFLADAIPRDWPFRHSEGNSDAHLKASFMGFSVQIPIEDGKLALGTWQGIYLSEFDGPRTRKASIIVQGS